MAISEYDAFGPWIYEISESHPLPPLFEGKCPPLDQTLLQLKLPRNIERRDATRDMDLYDYVLSADEKSLSIFERQDKEVEKYSINYDKIRAIRIGRELLGGNLKIFGEAETHNVPFNVLSIDLILKLTNLMRERYMPENSPNVSALADERTLQDFENADILFYHMLQEMLDNGDDIIAGTYQASTALRYQGNSVMMRRKDRRNHLSLAGAAHLITPNELIVIERQEVYDKEVKQGYGYQYTYLPLAYLTGIMIEPANNFEDMSILYVKTKRDTILFHFSSDNMKLIEFYMKLKILLNLK